jgi:hypothetical protein
MIPLVIYSLGLHHETHVSWEGPRQRRNLLRHGCGHQAEGGPDWIYGPGEVGPTDETDNALAQTRRPVAERRRTCGRCEGDPERHALNLMSGRR